MKGSSYHGKLGPSDESTAEVSLSSINTNSSHIQHLNERFHASLDMDTHNPQSTRERQRYLEAIVAGENEDDDNENDDDDDDNNDFQDSFAIGDDSNTNLLTQLTSARMLEDNYVSDVEEEREEDLAASSSSGNAAPEPATEATQT